MVVPRAAVGYARQLNMSGKMEIMSRMCLKKGKNLLS